MPTFDVLTMGRSCIDLYAHQIGVPITEVTSFDAYVGGGPPKINPRAPPPWFCSPPPSPGGGAPGEEGAVIVLVGTSLTHEPARSATLFAASRAAAAGKQVFVDIDYRPDLWNSRTDFANAVQALV